jgi:hypothetical protein
MPLMDQFSLLLSLGKEGTRIIASMQRMFSAAKYGKTLAPPITKFDHMRPAK